MELETLQLNILEVSEHGHALRPKLEMELIIIPTGVLLKLQHWTLETIKHILKASRSYELRDFSSQSVSQSDKGFLQVQVDYGFIGMEKTWPNNQLRLMI